MIILDKKLCDEGSNIILKRIAATRIYWFGYRVSGDAKPKSDYDFGFYAEDSRGADALVAIRSKIEQLPTLIEIDVRCYLP